MQLLRITAPKSNISGKVNLPLSKSIANRLLVMHALNGSAFEFSNEQLPEDTLLLKKILAQPADFVDAVDAGTVFRFLTAFFACMEGKRTLTGSMRMKERPVGPLVDALRSAGAKIEWLEHEGYPPLSINGRELIGGCIHIDASISSQFVSALLMIAPRMTNGLHLILAGTPTSIPYIKMTCELMKDAGIDLTFHDNSVIVKHGNYRSVKNEVERDWSAAAFWFELCALSESSELVLNRLIKETIQGDSAIESIMNSFAVYSEYTEEGLKISQRNGFIIEGVFKIDCADFPDMVPALVCTCAGLGVEAEFSGIHTLMIKESNRIKALQSELGKLNLKSDYDTSGDVLYLKKGRLKPFNGIINTHNDHRIAMSIAPLSLVCGPLLFNDASVVSKSYPGYWDQLISLGFIAESINSESKT